MDRECYQRPTHLPSPCFTCLWRLPNHPFRTAQSLTQISHGLPPDPPAARAPPRRTAPPPPRPLPRPVLVESFSQSQYRIFSSPTSCHLQRHWPTPSLRPPCASAPSLTRVLCGAPRCAPVGQSRRRLRLLRSYRPPHRGALVPK